MIAAGKSLSLNFTDYLPFYRHVNQILSTNEDWARSELAPSLSLILTLLSSFTENPTEETLARITALVQTLRTPRAEGLMRKYLSLSSSGSPTSEQEYEELPSHESVWIIKPAALSCGREIVVVTGLRQVLVQVALMGYNCVVQKYLERPLLVRRSRKFDIRQWVLVTNLNPLVIYGFSECYLRLSGREYSLARQDKFTHLCNHSIQKDDQHGGLETASDGGLCDTMMTLQEFKDHLRSLDPNTDLYATQIFPQIRDISIQSVSSCRDRLEKVGKGFEWLGLDLMVTENLEVALIEVNVSPDTTLSTPVTSCLVGPATKDLFNLLLQEQVASGTDQALDAVESYRECYQRSQDQNQSLTSRESLLGTRWISESGDQTIGGPELKWKLWYVGAHESQRDLKEFAHQKVVTLGPLRERASSSTLDLEREYKSLVDMTLSWNEKNDCEDEDEI
jgi:hypothetical protein